MLKSKYMLEAPHPKALSFHAGESFLPLHALNYEREWWLVLSKKAVVGYVPANYVFSIEVSTNEIVGFIGAARRQLLSVDGGQLEDGQLQRLDELLRRYSQRDPEGQHCFSPEQPAARPVSSMSLISEPDNTVEIPGPPADGVVGHDGRTCSNNSGPRQQLQQPPTAAQQLHQPSTTTQQLQHPAISSQYVRSLVDLVRQQTRASHQASLSAVTALMHSLKQTEPSIEPVMDLVLGHLPCISGVLQTEADLTRLLAVSPDARRLRVLLTELTAHTNDQQQRSWRLHNDEHVIAESLTELTAILRDADPVVCGLALSAGDQLQAVQSLALLYQMEFRCCIRRPLSDALLAACSLRQDVISLLLHSALPSELAREMLSSMTDEPRLCRSARLLSSILCMGDSLPQSHTEMLGGAFVEALLCAVEDSGADLSEETLDAMLAVLLSLNLQYSCPAENLLLQQLQRRSNAKQFTEKCMLLFNREEDPVRVFDHNPAPVNSVVKLMVDLFGCASTAQLFYTNDTLVLMDIVVRNMSDLSPGDPRRGTYIGLCGRVLGSTDFDEHRHRCDDIRRCLVQISAEEEIPGDPRQLADKQLAADVITQHRSLLTR